MSFSVYEITVPAMMHGLGVLARYLDHAQAVERDRGLITGEVLGARLAPDMATFGEQFSVGCDKVEAHVAELAQRGSPAPRELVMDYSALRARVADARAFLNSFSPQELSAAQTHVYEAKSPLVRGWFRGDDYIRYFIIPDFYFHITIAHAILRRMGAPIGKQDYLGNLIPGTAGDYS
ncbi:MAG: DUF1993 family protein [Parafilimonas terrae]|nr:DUF1993 family protein [Parafilimonas terrae]